jgi:hypothetical protein
MLIHPNRFSVGVSTWYITCKNPSGSRKRYNSDHRLSSRKVDKGGGAFISLSMLLLLVWLLVTVLVLVLVLVLERVGSWFGFCGLLVVMVVVGSKRPSDDERVLR